LARYCAGGIATPVSDIEINSVASAGDRIPATAIAATPVVFTAAIAIAVSVTALS
jgi:hypothetical protein